MSHPHNRIGVEEVFNRVGDPETFTKDLRDAQLERQIRRQVFIDNLDDDIKAEWIDGEAVYHSPAREAHNWTVHGLDVLLGNYSMCIEPIIVRVEKAMIEAGQHNFEPDVCIWRGADHEFDAEQYIYPRPDIAVEVLSKRTRTRDLGRKKEEYALAGTHEYWVIDAKKHTLHRFVNKDGVFEEIEMLQEDALLQSSFLPRLQVPMEAIWRDSARKAWTTQLVLDSLKST